MVGIFGSFFEGDAVADDVQTYAVHSEIHRVDVNINAADLTIKPSEKFLVESNLKHLTVEEKKGVLSVKETKKSESTYDGAVLTLYIPADTTFENIAIKTGAGKLTAERLSAGTIDFELGAGEVKIGSLVATSNAAIDGGAGKITIADGELHNLNLNMGVGQLHLTSALTGDCSFDLGVGKTNITVIGNRENYDLCIEKGIGSVTVDGAGVSNLNEQGSRENCIDLSGGIGAVDLKFERSYTN